MGPGRKGAEPGGKGGGNQEEREKGTTRGRGNWEKGGGNRDDMRDRELLERGWELGERGRE